MTTHRPRFDRKRFAEALAYAAQLHDQQTREGSDLPYVSQLLGVGLLWLMLTLGFEFGQGRLVGADQCRIRSAQGRTHADRVTCADALSANPRQMGPYLSNLERESDAATLDRGC